MRLISNIAEILCAEREREREREGRMLTFVMICFQFYFVKLEDAASQIKKIRYYYFG